MCFTVVPLQLTPQIHRRMGSFVAPNLCIVPHLGAIVGALFSLRSQLPTAGSKSEPFQPQDAGQTSGKCPFRLPADSCFCFYDTEDISNTQQAGLEWHGPKTGGIVSQFAFCTVFHIWKDISALLPFFSDSAWMDGSKIENPNPRAGSQSIFFRYLLFCTRGLVASIDSWEPIS